MTIKNLPSFSVFQVVLAPIAIGMTTNKFFPGFVKKILPFAPVVGVVSTCLLVASAVAQVAEPIINAGLSLQVRVLSFKISMDVHANVVRQYF